MDILASLSKLSLSNSFAFDMPGELWLEILPHLGKDDLRATTLVSRKVRWIAQSLLFAVFEHTLCPGFSEAVLKRLQEKITFYTSPDRAHVIQGCTVLGGRSNSPIYVEEICRALPKFHNLRHISIQYVRISSTLVAAIARAATAARMSLSLVSCMSNFTTGDCATVPLQELAVHNDYIPKYFLDNSWLGVLDLHALRVLNIARPHSTKSFMNIFITGIQLSTLEVLDLHLQGLIGVAKTDFVSSLACFPGLRTLHLHPPLRPDPTSWVHGSLDIPSTSLPALASFYGPSTQAAAFCTDGRPIKHLKLYGSADNTTCGRVLTHQLAEISRHAPGLASLELRDAELPTTVATTFPELRSLRLVVPHSLTYFMPDLHGVLASLESLVLPMHLTVLYLAFEHVTDIQEWGLPLSKDDETEAVMRDLGRRHPLLCEISLQLSYSNSTEWRWICDSADSERRGSVTSRRSVGLRYLDIREPTLSTNSDAQNRAADELDEEWMEATRTHRG
ncbi:hypothetical protein B0H11DRAFT_330128 [Mycena galericulata]|nr:hypothetical protein B0H11DRAFT_330128 [Mycena galericulata]